MTLVETKPGDEVVIDPSPIGRNTVRQLCDLGLLPGTRIKVIASHPFHGPILIRVGQSTVAIGRRIATRIHVSK